MFINKYLAAGGDYPIEMQTEGWVYLTNNQWWPRLVGYVLGRFVGVLERLDLYAVVRDMKFGLLLSINNFFNILVHYNMKIHTFFTLIREMGMEQHEMHEVTGLPEGEYPYEEFTPNKWKLRS